MEEDDVADTGDQGAHATERAEGDGPSLRQVLHAATGDRDAEAAALADDAGDVDPDDAKVAVQRAHGESVEEPIAERDVARPDDVEG